MKKAADTFTHIENIDDVIFLRKKAFPVNMRLFRSNKTYNKLIHSCAYMVSTACLEEYSDYKKPHGMSGANLAIPFNIIGVVKNRGSKDEHIEIMLNPEIVGHSIATTKVKSNCGSIRLEKMIEVERYNEIHVRWYNLNGDPKFKSFNKLGGGFTIQHEIDHNNGVLITDNRI
jgi:peptide deformylase